MITEFILYMMVHVQYVTWLNGFHIKQAIGKLNLIGARCKVTPPIIKEIQDKGLNLDESMVIRFRGRLYHGADDVN